MSQTGWGGVELFCEIGFGSGALATTPTWTDVTDYLRLATIRRGRSTLRDTVQAGTCDLTFDNSDRRFDPVNTASPYSPNVIPAVQVRLRAVYNAVTYHLFRGTIDRWPQTWDQARVDAVTVVQAQDDFKLIGLGQLSASEVLELTGTRIGNILDDIGWSATRRSLDAGTFNVVASNYDCVNPLTELQAVADSEVGLVFMAGNGDVVFQDRNHRSGLAVSATFSDQGSNLEYHGLVLPYDDSQLWNSVEGTRSGSTATRAADDPTSVTNYGRRHLQLNELLLTNDTDLQTVVDLYRDRFKDPKFRFEPLTVKGEADPTNLWPVLLDAEISDKFTVIAQPPGSGTPTTISKDVHVENISHTITPSNWLTQFVMSEA